MGVYETNRFQQYQTKSVFVSSGAADSNQTVSGSIRQLSRIQDVNWSIPYPVEQVMYLDQGDEAYMGSHNSVDVTMTYWHTNGRNEQALGLIDWIGPGQLGFKLDEEKNIYISIENTPGVDAVGAPTGGSRSVIGMAQGLLTSYAMSVQNGGLIQSRATMNCLTAFSYTGASGNQIPAVRYGDGAQLTGLFTLPTASSQYDVNATGLSNDVPAVAAIGARDMVMLFPEGTPFSVVFSGAQACYLQGFDLTMTMPRRELKPIGAQYPPNRAVFYPIEVNLTTNTIVNAYQRDQLDRIDCLGTGQSVWLLVKQPCSSDVLFGFFFDRLQILNQDFSSSIGTNDSMTIQWKGLLTSPYTTFFTPYIGSLVLAGTTSGWGSTW